MERGGGQFGSPKWVPKYDNLPPDSCCRVLRAPNHDYLPPDSRCWVLRVPNHDCLPPDSRCWVLRVPNHDCLPPDSRCWVLRVPDHDCLPPYSRCWVLRVPNHNNLPPVSVSPLLGNSDACFAHCQELHSEKGVTHALGAGAPRVPRNLHTRFHFTRFGGSSAGSFWLEALTQIHRQTHLYLQDLSL